MMTLLDKSRMIKLHLQGKSNREIGRTLHVSRNTVGKYAREYERLRSELTMRADGLTALTEATTTLGSGDRQHILADGERDADAT